MTIFIEFIAIQTIFLILCILTLTVLCSISYALFNSSLNLSAIIAINLLLVVFPFTAEIVQPNILSTASCWPLPHVTSMAFVFYFYFL